MSITTIEQVAKILLTNNVPFSYDGKYVIVNNSDISYNLFHSASYHLTTKKLVLMTGADKGYKEISIEAFKSYFSIYHKVLN